MSISIRGRKVNSIAEKGISCTGGKKKTAGVYRKMIIVEGDKVHNREHGF